MRFLIFVAVFSVQTVLSNSEPIRSPTKTLDAKREDDTSSNEISDSFDEIYRRDFNKKLNRAQKQVDSSSEAEGSSSTTDSNDGDGSDKGTGANNNTGCEFFNNLIQQGVQVLGALISDVVNIVTKLCTNSTSLLGTGKTENSTITTTTESSSSFAETITSTDNPM